MSSHAPSSHESLMEMEEIIGLSSSSAPPESQGPIRPVVRRRASISTRHILKNFVREPSSDHATKPTPTISQASLDRERARKAIEYLKKERVGNLSRTSLKYFLSSSDLPQYYSDQEESVEKKRACAYYRFIPRARVQMHIVDFDNEKATHNVYDASRFMEFTTNKPSNVTIRWIHVPVGLGLFQSTLEDLFLLGYPQRTNSFPFSYSPEWPYPEMNMLSFYSHEHFKEQIEAFQVLSDHLHLNPEEGLTEEIKKDLKWRANHLHQPLDYWKLLKADFPVALNDFASLGEFLGPIDVRQAYSFDRQKLSDHPQFANATLMISKLRAFNRPDGMLLTFSNTPGVDYITKHFNEHLDLPGETLLENEEASALSHVMKAFLTSGTSRWHRPSVEWLIVYLFTEAVVSPNALRGGHNGVEPLIAYKQLMFHLKQKQRLPWTLGQGPKLVREYHDCLDELRAIKSAIGSNLRVMRGMVKDCEFLEKAMDIENNGEQDRVSDEAQLDPADETESMEDRLKWAIEILERNDKDTTLLISTIETMSKDYLNLCTIEQNDRSIVADYQNEAIMVFTAVTVVFLPLSFFTSYFGMNLSTIRDTDKTEGYFWKACGILALLITIGAVLYPAHRVIMRYLKRFYISLGVRISRFIRGMRHNSQVP